MLINGQPNNLISVLDRGFQYGDGLFETLAVIDGKAALFERHLARLRHGCQRLGISEPDFEKLRSEVQQVISGTAKGVLKIIITRGAGGRGYSPQNASEPTRIIYTSPWPEYPEENQLLGVQACICTTRLSINERLAGIKHLNRLEQVLARGEWNDANIREGVMLDTAGQVVEGTMSNLFLVAGEIIKTPKLDRCGVDGIMRGVVIEQAEKIGLEVQESRLSPEDLKKAKSLFFTNSLIGIWPVRTLDGVEYPVHPITRTLIQRVMECGFAAD